MPPAAATNTRIALTVVNLTVTVGHTPLLEAVSFEVTAGKVTGIFGRSGAGKSTLLSTIAGIQHPSFAVTGEITLVRDCTRMNLREIAADVRSLHGMATVQQDLELFPDMTVLENVAYPLRLRGVPRRLAERQAVEALASFHIAELAGRHPDDELSGGQRQRVALARATIYSPDVLLLDEPFKGLEQDLREQLLAVIRIQAVQHGRLVLMASHEHRDLELAADTIIEVRDKRVYIQPRRDDTRDGGTTFDLLKRRFLIPASPSAEGQFVRASQVCVQPNGVYHDRAHSLHAVVIECRAINGGRTATLLDYGHGQFGWAESDTPASCLPAGTSVVVSFEQENDNAIQ